MSKMGDLAKKTRSNRDLNIYWSEMKTLIRLGIVEGVKKRIKRGEDVNKMDKFEAPIHVAVETGNLVILKLLIDAGADVNLKRNSDDKTPLFLAKDLKTVKILVKAGADVNLSISGFIEKKCVVDQILDRVLQG